MYFDGEWRILFGGDDAEAEYGPTHWMPLPEPPKSNWHRTALALLTLC